MVKFQADFRKGPKLSTSDLGGSGRSILKWGGGAVVVFYLVDYARNRGVDTLNDVLPGMLKSDPDASDSWEGW